MAGIETLYKEQENKTDITLPSPGILCGEDKAPESLALKVRGTHSGEIQTLWKRQTPLLKGAHKISHALRAREGAVIWKEPGQNYCQILKNLPERQRSA